MSKIPVKILGREIEADTDFLDVHELLLSDIIQYVEDACRQAQNKDPNVVDTQKLTIIAALKIASDFFKVKEMNKNISNGYERKINEMIKVIDETGLLN